MVRCDATRDWGEGPAGQAGAGAGTERKRTRCEGPPPTPGGNGCSRASFPRDRVRGLLSTAQRQPLGGSGGPRGLPGHSSVMGPRESMPFSPLEK